ncbi:MAG: cytochrome b [Rhodobacteraceae bacterium]|nr:MAG: cytochrome b [Paracoccaceae bacterium]
MRVFNTETGWGWPARALHWAMAALILFMLGLGYVMVNMTPDLFERFRLTQIHKSWGFVVFALALARLGWRALNRRAPEPPGQGWQAKAAKRAHVAFYALMFILPISGWLMASASELQDLYNIRNMVFGLFELPDPFVPGDRRIEAVFKAIHVAAAVALAALLVAHALAALKHHFIDRDRVLMRMVRGE